MIGLEPTRIVAESRRAVIEPYGRDVVAGVVAPAGRVQEGALTREQALRGLGELLNRTR
jgi:hypothetical protein